MRRIVCLALATLAMPSLARAQSHPLIGQWQISMETLVPPGTGGPSTIERKGQLSVAQAGDSLIATLTLEAVPWMPTPKVERLAALRGTGTVAFVKTADATMTGNGQMLARAAGITYALDVQDDRLVGSMRVKVEGIPDIPARPITGTRAP